MIVIVDYGAGNLGSIVNMFRRIGADAQVSSQENVIAAAGKLVLPGVGRFDAGMEGLKNRGLISVLSSRVTEGVPLLGICLGMHLLLDRSEEGSLNGLGFISGAVKRLPSNTGLKIPHMGWNSVILNDEDILMHKIPEPKKFYFAHSYYAAPADNNDVFLWTDYGIKFASGIHRKNIYGVQFHPEKSHRYGMQLFRNFIEL